MLYSMTVLLLTSGSILSTMAAPTSSSAPVSDATVGFTEADAKALLSNANNITLQQDSCASWNRDGVNWNLAPKMAVEAGLEGILLQAMAYERKAGQNGVQRNDWPSDAYPPDLMNGRLTEIVDSAVAPKDGAFGFSALLDGETPILAFAGSTDMTNWKDNFKSVASADADLGGKMYKVGKGFYDEYKEVMATLEGPIKALMDAHDGKLLIVGHSLGGAIANIAAVDMANKFSAKVALRTAGSPRVFAWRPEDSAERVQTELLRMGSDAEKFGAVFPTAKGIVIQRLTNYADIVPTVPYCSGGYMHTGPGGWYIRANLLGYHPKAYALQHQDFTPYQDATTATAAAHGLGKYYERLREFLVDVYKA